MPASPKITPFLWFDDDAEEAIRFYASIFPDTKTLSQSRWGPGGPVPAGTLMTARIRLGGQEYLLLNAGPTYRLNEAFSLFVSCETQAEVDDLWKRLTADGGEPRQCGWLKDRFGLSWQIIPSTLTEMLSDKDPARAGRVAKAMMSMQKLDIAKLQAAWDGR
jgi:predicted 3-demethylubiquinone-9 3-methyltransferase (glyoxalase superfamily)